MSSINPLQLSKPQLGFSNLLLFILSIAGIAIGSVYLNECPQQPLIPIYLIVVGVFGLVLGQLSNPCYTKWASENPLNPFSMLYTMLCILTFSFLFCWFIVGNVWIYSIYEPNYNKNMTHVEPVEPYCNKTLYLFAFWTTTLVYILVALPLFCCCCCLCCGGGNSQPSSTTTTVTSSSTVIVSYVSDPSLRNSNVPA